MDVTQSLSWQELIKHKKRLDNISLNELFTSDPDRFTNFSRTACDLLYDFSKQRLDNLTLQSLQQLAVECELSAHIQDLFTGKNVNKTENRPALHMQLRKIALAPEIQEVRERLDNFVGALHAKKYLGVTDVPIKHVLSIGIGGSDLGPLMACEALKNFQVTDLKLYFVSNVDGDTLNALLDTLPPAETICLVNSKTFTTSETMLNAQEIKAWFTKHLGANAVHRQMFGITANRQKAKDFGIAVENIFTFWDWVGGRYSIWSAVGLPLELMLGSKQFQDFLLGANVIDEHFSNIKFADNLPVLMALIGIWNINFQQSQSLLVMPYLDCLRNFPAYLQQLEMESNGKSAINSGGYAKHMTAPIIWGGVGCNGQHAYMQLLHQGTNTIPIDFIAAVNSHRKSPAHQDLLLASCLSQSKALMNGISEQELLTKHDLNLAEAKMCPGNRPTSTILFAELTPKILGSLIALYEHKVFVQGVIWQIQSFDQWGVELGKNIIKELLPMLQQQDIPKTMDSSTAGLLEYIRKYRYV